MVSVGVNVKSSESADSLKGKLDALKDVCGAAVRAAGSELQSLAKGFVPVDTGTLRDSISLNVIVEDGFAAAAVAPNTKYDIFVEFGTGRRGGGGGGAGLEKGANRSYTHGHKPGQAPTPYMHPAYKQVAQNLKENLAKMVAQAFKGG